MLVEHVSRITVAVVLAEGYEAVFVSPVLLSAGSTMQAMCWVWAEGWVGIKPFRVSPPRSILDKLQEALGCQYKLITLCPKPLSLNAPTAYTKQRAV